MSRKRFRRMSRGVIWIVAIVTAMPGILASGQFVDYPSKRASECVVKTVQGDVMLGVLPMDDVGEQKKYFKAELTAKGVLPILIVLENGSGEDSILFDKKAITYGTGSAGTVVANSVGRVAMIPLVGDVFTIAAFNAENVRQNVLRKEIRSKTIAAGMAVQGFLYVAVPKKGPRDKIHLQVPIVRSGSGAASVLDVIF